MSRLYYIAGPMTGLPEFNYPTFHAVAAACRERSWEVVSPAELFEGKLGLPWADYMKHGLKAMLDCTNVIMLPGWASSRGARIEHQLAVTLGLTIQHAQDIYFLQPVLQKGKHHGN